MTYIYIDMNYVCIYIYMYMYNGHRSINSNNFVPGALLLTFVDFSQVDPILSHPNVSTLVKQHWAQQRRSRDVEDTNSMNCIISTSLDENRRELPISRWKRFWDQNFFSIFKSSKKSFRPRIHDDSWMFLELEHLERGSRTCLALPTASCSIAPGGQRQGRAVSNSSDWPLKSVGEWSNVVKLFEWFPSFSRATEKWFAMFACPDSESIFQSHRNMRTAELLQLPYWAFLVFSLDSRECLLLALPHDDTCLICLGAQNGWLTLLGSLWRIF